MDHPHLWIILSANCILFFIKNAEGGHETLLLIFSGRLLVRQVTGYFVLR